MAFLWVLAAACVLLFIFALVQKLVKMAVVTGLVLVLGFVGFVMLKEGADPATAEKMDEAASALGHAAGSAAKKTAEAAAPLARKAADAAKPHAEKAARAAAAKTAELAGKVADEVKDKVVDEMRSAMLGDDDDSAAGSEPAAN
jgi:biopolymer transport protein ExbB/TolQ